MIEIRGVVMKLEFTPPRCLWRRLNAEILLGDPWEWSPARRDAYVFASLEEAEQTARQCGPHAHAVVTGVDDERAARGLMPAAAARPAFRSEHDETQRQRHQEMLERMHLQ